MPTRSLRRIGTANRCRSCTLESLPYLIERARSFSQHKLAAEVAASKRIVRIPSEPDMSADERDALAAYEALMLIERLSKPVRRQSMGVQLRLRELLM
jgi:hypothetical protein